MDATDSRSSPWIAASVDELTADASARESAYSTDAKSGAVFERLVIDGSRYFLKVLSPDSDWIMRCTGNLTHWEFQVWRAGRYQSVPDVIDPAMVGMALEERAGQTRLAMLMHDRPDDLVPPGDEPIPSIHHHDFIDHMAAMHASALGWCDDISLATMENRLLFFAPQTIAPELGADDVPGAIQVADRGWSLLPRRSPELYELVRGIHEDPVPLADALRSTPLTFVAGDWKLGNLGRSAGGRTVLLDWAYPGAAPPCWELAWYLALNRARIPESKEATIELFRARLERHGVVTDDWWDRQLGLSLLGMAAVFAWEKAIGDQDELDWWTAAAISGAEVLG